MEESQLPVVLAGGEHRRRQALTIEDKDVEDVRYRHAEERDHDERVRDLPLERDEAGRRDAHADAEREHDGEHRPEAPEESGELLKDGRILDVLLSRRPGLQDGRDRISAIRKAAEGKRRTML